jgi:hypothetical protein
MLKAEERGMKIFISLAMMKGSPHYDVAPSMSSRDISWVMAFSSAWVTRHRGMFRGWLVTGMTCNTTAVQLKSWHDRQTCLRRVDSHDSVTSLIEKA